MGIGVPNLFTAICRRGCRFMGLLAVLLCLCTGVWGAVTVTSGTGGTGICSNKAVSGTAPGFTSLGPIVVAEGVNTDFAAGTCTIVLNAPAGWQFSGTLPTLNYITGSNITGISGTISSTALTVNITVAATTGGDQFTIAGLQVQPTSTSASAGNIYTSSVSGITGIFTGTGGTNFASLSVAAPVTASVSISAAPAGAFCPGTNVVFTATPVNGGTPTFAWVLNGADVFLGSSFSSNTLVNGNTVSCRMLSSIGCLTGNPVFSNTITASVLPAPAAITGPTNVCPGNTITQGNTTASGVWSSTNPAAGTINSSGAVTGIAAGTTTISYLFGGCASSRTVFVNNHPFPPALTPTSAAMCHATTMTVTATGTAAPASILSQNFNAGLGTWTVDTTGSVNLLNGAQWKACADSYQNEQGWYRSPDHSTFIMANADTSGSLSTLSTRLTSPMFSLADYASATLSFQHAYDYWPAGDVSVNLEISTNGGSTWSPIVNFRGANVGSKMAFVSQSYSLNAYLGYPNVKIRFLYHSNFGYYWAIDNIVITGTPGVVTPTWSPTTYLYTDAAHTVPYTGGATNTVYVYPASVATPTPITYTATATNGACSNTATSTVTVNPSPGAVTGGLNVCVATTSVLGNAALGGTWVSSNTDVATIGSNTGMVTGVTPGTVTVSYTLGSSCMTTAVVTVNVTPAPITGNQNVCLNYTSTLTDISTGGAWTTDNPTVAPVNMTTGEVYGFALGTANITYSLGTGCEVTKQVTVQPLPAAVSGLSVVCAAETITLGSSSGGTWVSGSGATATVGASSGIVTGVAGGTVNISYVLTGTGCFTLKTVTVNPKEAISGPTSVCVGYGATLLNGVAGGTWTSGTTATANIHSTSGYVTAMAVGTTNITYALPTGCVSYRELTVDPIPADITGATSVCLGSNITLANITPGGSWSSSNASVASVGGGGGTVTGNATGTAVVSYTISTGCFKTVTVTVLPVPAVITGTAAVCEAGVTVLACATGSGSWSSSNGNATVVNGTVSGVSAGPVTITYTIPNTCFAIRNVTVNPLPGNITGQLAVCQLLNSTLSSSSTGGSWTSSNTIVATIGNATGVLVGGAAGTTNITYTLPTGCLATAVATVNSLPGALSGPSTVCTGTSVVLTSSTTGGSWTSSNAFAGVAGGTVTGVSTGNVTITYTLPTSCIAVKAMTVNASPAPITGVMNVCEGATTLLSSTTANGGWTSGNTPVGSVHPVTGLVTGVAAGTANITYMVVTGCIASTTVTVMPVPAAITGNTNVCPGTSSTLNSATAGGVWSSSNTAAVTAGTSSGIITGVLPGTSNITYTLPTGCYASASAVTNTLPSAISGAATVCVDANTVYSNTTPTGSWSSSNTVVATAVTSSGIITGVAAGTAVISYTLLTGCAATKIITVNSLPSAITGPDNICQGATHTMGSTPTGGVWSSSTPTVGTIGLLSGDLYGVSGGTATVTYTTSVGSCRITKQVTVTALPMPISGAGSVCVGSNISLTDGTPGGSWTSGNAAAGTISLTGSLTGIAQGTTTVTYAMPVGCAVTKLISVNPLPANITGNTSLCIGVPSTLSSATTGGVWTSASPVVASVGASSGTVSGFVLNTTTISYALPTGCYKTTTVTVNFTPAAISGPSALCEQATTVWTDPSLGGTWTSSNSAVATVGSSTGLVSGLAAGTATVSYTVFTGCFAVKSLTVNPLPNDVTGPMGVCAGYSITMSNTTSGGTWVSSNTSVASVGSMTGIAVGNVAGTTNISYVLPTACATFMMVTVHALPSAINGSSTVCQGSTTALTTSTGGGTWTSSNPAVASVLSGVVSGVSLGSAVITYTLGAGCFITKAITVNPLPPAITGAGATCPGVPMLLTNSAGTGAWSSTTSPGVATVGTFTGIVNPISAGTAVITYTLPTGCRAYTTVTVNATAPVSGPDAICMGVPATYTHSVAGGTWSSSNTLIASIGSATGLAIGFSANTVTLSYLLPGGCVAAKQVTINTVPASIVGASSVCPGFTAALASSTTGGSWSSSNTAYATIVSTSGVATGVAAGVTNISYILSTGCFTTRQLTVNAAPAPITGTASVCTGTTTALAIVTTGGAWSSGSTAVATVNAATGVVAGMAVGTATISYIPATGCASTAVVTVSATPSAISGTSIICNGTNTTFTNATVGGSWGSSNATVASMNGSGVMTGVSPGTAIISYTTSVGCSATRGVTINITPSDIGGVPSVCVGYTTLLNSGPSGGTWTSGSPAIASVPAGAGLISGVAAGTTVVTYRLATGCRATVTVTVSASPGTIAGATSVCEGSNTTLSDPMLSGGTWSSSNATVAAIGSLTGVVTGGVQGTVTVTYMIGSGCISTAPFTVNPVPMAISGTDNACIGMTTTLNTTTTGGIWSSADNLTATVGTGNGVVSGVNAGTAYIYYTLPTSCRAARVVTVNPIPGAIGGTAAVCVNSVTTLTNSVPGGSWSSGDASVGTVNAASGAVAGIAAGTVMMTYTLGAGCIAVREVTVNPLPAAITGTFTVCNSMMTTLANATGGGTWSVGAGGVASVGAASGNVTGLVAGTAQVSYALGTGCAVSSTVTVHPFAANAGGTIACVGFTTALSNPIAGGTWSSDNTAVATVGSGTGLVLGVTPGTAVISYSLPTGCVATSVVTVTALSSVTGGANVCRGLTTALGNPVPGGVWSTSNAAIATVGAGSGVVTGVVQGTANISYTYGPGCVSVVVATVHPLSGIVGSGAVCAGQSVTLSNPVPGGTWSTGSANATVDAASGVVTGVSAGTANISYSLATGCVAAKVVTVHPLSPIMGASSICLGATAALSNLVAGGTWSSIHTGVASINAASGLVSGVSVGTASISYTVSTGCNSSFTVTVQPLPAAITGATAVCENAAITLNNATTGGTWSSSNANVTVGAATGVVTGVTGGTSVLSYILPTGCYKTTTVTVNALPPAILGSLQVCVGSVGLLGNAVGGGAWSSSNAGVATVNLVSGAVTGVGQGTASVTYTLPTTCATAAVVTVNALPNNITGLTSVCIGASVTMSSTTTGGTWSAANATVSVAALTGDVAGVSPGTAVITYTLPTGCLRTHTVTVFAPPSVITGPAQVCEASTIQLLNSTTGGTWTSAHTATATINAGSGMVTGVAAGTALISYSQASGCSATYLITVNPLPAALTGAMALCTGSSSVLSSATAGGGWSSSANSIAGVNATGTVSGTAAGNAVITYILSTGCKVTANVTVQPLPATLTGAYTVCAGSVTNLGSTTAGGMWSSSNAAAATVDVAGGTVTGVAPGTTNITYMLGTGCQRAVTVTVNLTPVAITGPLNVCKSATVTLADATPGGVWSSGTTTVASVSAGGVVNGVNAGTSLISYTLPGTGCRATATATVNPLPLGIAGIIPICPGTGVALSNTMTGGTWATTSAAVTVDATSGMVMGVASGFAVVTYTLPTGCSTASTIVVNPLPAIITGMPIVCENGSTTLFCATGGGAWVSGVPLVATVNASGGVTGVSAGTAVVSYVLSTGCKRSVDVTVNPLPALIAGATSACLGASMSLINSSTGGTWASGNTAVAAVGITSGMVTGLALGTANVTYTLPTGCKRSVDVTVNPLPAAITGTGLICQGNTTVLASSTPGGMWSSGNTAVGTASGAVGAVTGVGAGMATISYTLSTGCASTTVLTVNALLPITGLNTFCAGDTSVYINGVPGGTWSAAASGVVTINAMGTVTGITGGVTLISYTLPSGCVAERAITVNSLPVAFYVIGGGTFCAGSTVPPISLTGSVTGFDYRLYNGSSLISTLAGTGATLNYGVHTVAGSYMVRATNPATGCVRTMVGTVNVTPVAVAPATVSIFSPVGDTICNGTSVLFSAVPTMGGSSPTYQWRVNGTVVGGASSYAYTPADGDVITCQLVSSSPCAVPAIASGGLNMRVLPTVYPDISIHATPDGRVCALTPVSFVAAAVNGGLAPVYKWQVNGVLAHMGVTFSYVPADEDAVRCVLLSNARCRNVDSVTSNTVAMDVAPMVIPIVTVNANPGFNVTPGTVINFSATAVNTGGAPAYQWKINGSAITGATNATFSWSTFAGGEAVSCEVTSNGECGGYTGADTGIVSFNTSVQVNGGAAQLAVYPNPNNGNFVLRGRLPVTVNTLNIRVTNVLGQELAGRTVTAANGAVNECLTVGTEYANGMYMLTAQTDDGAQYVFHFVVER